MITIKDVAILAETSTATVSRVLNGDSHVSPVTRQKILQVIDATGYKPRVSSKADSQKKRILVLLPSLENPYFFTILKGVEHKASANGYDTLTCVTHRDHATEKHYLDMLSSGLVDGAILFTTSLPPEELSDMSSRYPMIQCGAIAEGPGISYVSIDDKLAAYDATSYLISLGNKRIAFITSSNNIPFEKKRHTGYVNALTDHAIPYIPDYEVTCNNHYLDSYRCVEELMELQEKPTAFFCFSDLTALGVLNYMYNHNLKPGVDLDVLGFDGTYLTECTSPNLSVIEQPAYEMGKHAFSMLSERIKDIDYIVQKVILSHKLVIRDTTRKTPLPDASPLAGHPDSGNHPSCAP